MQDGAPIAGRARLSSRLAPWRRVDACAAVLAGLCVGLAAAIVAAIARRHDLASVASAPGAGSDSAVLVVAAAGFCAAACAWLELRAGRRGYCERLDERLGLQGALCAAVDGAPTRLSDALAGGLLPRVAPSAMARVACARLWPALFVLCGAGAAWLASESWLERRAAGVAPASPSMVALADELQRAALDARTSEARARLAAAAAAARRLSVAEREASAEGARTARSELLGALEQAAQAVGTDESERVQAAASRARLALGPGGSDGRADQRQARGESAPASGGRAGDSGAAFLAAGEAGMDGSAPGSGRPEAGRGSAGLASGAGGGTISTPEFSRGPLLAPTILETLPAHEAGWLSDWAARERSADGPPR
jgi:hypothetical protein